MRNKHIYTQGREKTKYSYVRIGALKNQYYTFLFENKLHFHIHDYYGYFHCLNVACNATYVKKKKKSFLWFGNKKQGIMFFHKLYNYSKCEYLSGTYPMGPKATPNANFF